MSKAPCLSIPAGTPLSQLIESYGTATVTGVTSLITGLDQQHSSVSTTLPQRPSHSRITAPASTHHAPQTMPAPLHNACPEQVQSTDRRQLHLCRSARALHALLE
eukprot:1657623-Rhodomonas_salina.5